MRGTQERDGPAGALRRAAFLLERSRAGTFRVAAFRRAAGVVDALDPGELARRAAQGTLAELPGLGATTAGVVAEALRGQVPAYLRRLEEEAAVPLATGGEALRAALRGDLHLHSDDSDGGSPLEEMARTAAALGHEYAALTDHSARLRVARGLSRERRERQLERIAALAPRLAPFRLLAGIEVDVLDDGSLDCGDDLLARLDVVVASVHSGLRADAAVMTERVLAAVRGGRADVLGHCTGRRLGAKPRPPSTFDAEAVFAACAEHRVAVEVNCRPDRLDPPLDLLRLAVDAGCLFAVSTDAHAPGQLDWQVYGCARAAGCGVPAGRVVNTWPVAELLAWTGRRRSR
ncbi:PHP domain-containing protein [Kineococcus sp. NUM-3379]